VDGVRLAGKQAYDAEIENPEFTGSPTITIVRMAEEDDVIMTELTIEAARKTGEQVRMVAGETFVMRDAKISERRAYLIALTENDYK
jgi:hypothetical protein